MLQWPWVALPSSATPDRHLILQDFVSLLGGIRVSPWGELMQIQLNSSAWSDFCAHLTRAARPRGQVPVTTSQAWRLLSICWCQARGAGVSRRAAPGGSGQRTPRVCGKRHQEREH